MRAYGPFVEAGVSVFWEARRRGLAVVAGLGGSGPVLLESYPRFVIRQLWPELRPIPSKRKAAADYVAELWARLCALGLAGRRPRRHDEIDALLCALAARSWLRSEAVEVGEPPRWMTRKASSGKASSLLRAVRRRRGFAPLVSGCRRRR